MFFKKFIQTPPEMTPIDLSGRQPVYILGENALALFLSAKLQQNGNNVILLNPQAPATSIKMMGFTLKEEYNLQKNSFNIPTTSRIITEPQIIIIASDQYNLKSNLTLLPSKTFPNSLLLCFSHIENQETIRPLLGCKMTRACFNGYLELDGSSLTAFGLAPQITITSAKNEKETEKYTEIFQNSDIKITTTDNDTSNFWESFAPFIIGYLSSVPRQHISEQINNKESKKIILSAISEICQLAKFEQVQLSESDLLRQLLEIPKNFYFKKNRRSRTQDAAELDSYYSLLIEKARIYKCKIPQLNILMKNNYNQLLKK